MATPIPAGSVSTVQISAESSWPSSPSTDIADILIVLGGSGLQSVGSPVISSSSLLAEAGEYIGAPVDYQATLQLNNFYVSDSDALAGMVNAAFDQIDTGASVYSAAVTQVTPPSGTAASTGQPGNVSTGVGAPGTGIAAGIGNTISNAVSGLTSGVWAILIGIAVIVILVLVLAAYGPNVKDIAGAAAVAAI